jgi:hypothetical protein
MRKWIKGERLLSWRPDVASPPEAGLGVRLI